MTVLPAFRVAALFSLALLLLAGVFALAARQSTGLIDNAARVEETYEVLSVLEHMGQDIKEIESSTRGYVLMGDASYLEPYRQSRQRLRQQLSRVQGLLQVQAAHAHQLPPLARAIALRLAFSERLIELRQRQGFDAAYHLKRQGLGLKLATDIRRRLDQLMNAERRLLDDWLEREHDSARQLTVWMALSGLLAVALNLLALGLILGAWRKRQQAEQALQQAYAHTAELAAFSQALNQHAELEPCLQTLSERYAVIFTAARYSIFSYDSEAQTLNLLAHNHPDLAAGDILPLEATPLMRYALESRQTVHQDQGRGSSQAHPCEGSICVPMVLDDTVLGVINLSHFPTGPVSQETLHRLSQIAAHLASALRRSLLYDQLATTVRYDHLTGCFNRRALYEQLEQEVQRCQRYGELFSLLMLDLDYFKQVNDRYGHQTGDELLRAMAARLQSVLRQTDRLCRYGGEEFVVLLPNTSGADANILAERLRLTLAQAPLLQNPQVSITCSLGVAAWQPSLSADGLLNQADQALYAAKHAGRNRVHAATHAQEASEWIG